MTRPNILFFMTDQQRADAMGCSGGWLKTPNLDRIAREGVRFSRCVTTTPICVPARVTLATGRYPHNNAVWTNVTYTLPEDAATWMRVIRDLGYRTSLFGKTHLHPHRGDLRDSEHLLHAYGLDDVNEIGGPRASANVGSHMTAMWEEKGLLEAYRADFNERFDNKPHVVRPSVLPLEDYYDVYVGQCAKLYLEEYDRREPWFCWVSFGGPHEPWDTPEPYASMYEPDAMPTPIPRAADDHDRPRGWLDHRMEHGSPKLYPGDEAAMRANYAGNVTLIDHQIGEVLEAVEKRGELGRTIIAFTSDHGEMNGDWGLIYKMNFLGGAVSVPLIVRTPETSKEQMPPGSASDPGQLVHGRRAGPGHGRGRRHRLWGTAANGGRVNDAPAENCDLGPTLVELAGGEIEYQQFAKSLVPAMSDGSTAPHREDAISEIQGEVMLADAKWKTAINDDGQVYLLFDLENDPDETRNLAGLDDYRDVGDGLRLRILERIVQSQLKVP